mgnify:CR=1 FL=1
MILRIGADGVQLASIEGSQALSPVNTVRRMARLPSRSRCGAIALLVTVLVALGAAGAARPIGGAPDVAALNVMFGSQGGQSYLLVGLEGLSSTLGADGTLASTTAALTVTSPPGFSVAVPAPGTPAGQVLGVLTAGNGDTSGAVYGGGTLTTVDPADFATDPTAQQCVPGVHALVLRASFTVLGQIASLPAALDVDPVSKGFTLRMCTVVAPSARFPKGLALHQPSVFLTGVVDGPDGAGEYLWNARVTPTIGGTVKGDPGHAFDIRARIVVPHVLTVRTSYDARHKRGIVSGRLTLQGKPRPGTEVEIAAFSGDDDLGQATVHTDASGEFSAHVPVKGRTQVNVEVPYDPTECRDASDAPGGCVSETLMTPDPVMAIIRAPRANDAQRRTTTSDNAIARRATVRPTDVPKGWRELPYEVEGCDAFRPDLRRLTVTGEARSQWFLSGKQDATIGSVTTLYRTRGEATTAFERIAQLANARCEAVQGEIDDYVIETVAKAGFPTVGDAARAFHLAWSSDSDPDENGELVFVRVGRVILEFQSYSYDGPRPTVLRNVVRQVVGRARTQ